MVSNSGKSTIDLNLTRCLKNIKFVTKVFIFPADSQKIVEVKEKY